MLKRILLLAATLSLSACAGLSGTHTDRADYDSRKLVVSTALDQIGVPYHYGGTTPTGFDCSGLVQFSYAQAGIALPHQTGELIKAGPRISYADAKPGDLLFYSFRDRRRRSQHVGIYLGDDKMVHAPVSGSKVEIVQADDPSWTSHFVGAVRVLR
jgi:murein DD-endopeptidase